MAVQRILSDLLIDFQGTGDDVLIDKDGIKIGTEYVITEAEITARTLADSTLQGNIDTEATIRYLADLTLQNQIDLVDPDVIQTVQTNLDSEVTARTLADSTLQSNLLAEVTARTLANTTLQANINTEANTRSLADITLQNNIDSETTARSIEDTSIRTLLSGLANAFIYRGTVTGGTEGSPTQLNDLTYKTSGSYYKVTTAGWFIVGSGTAFFANQNDGLVWNDSSNVDIIDNTNGTVAGTSGYITVTGTADTGYVIDIAEAFKNTVTTLQSNLLAEVTARTLADTTLQANINSIYLDSIAASLILA